MNKKVLIITTNVDVIDGDHPTGLWFEEFATPYRQFKQAGFEVTIASPKGGATPIDAASLGDVNRSDWEEEFAALEKTRELAGVDRAAFDAVYFPGGHGPVIDIPGNSHVKTMLAAYQADNKVIGAVCHGVAALLEADNSGTNLVKGRRVTAFSDTEEIAVGLDKRVPYSVEQRLVEAGGQYSKVADWQPYTVADGNLITGQNPASSEGVAAAMISALS